MRCPHRSVLAWAVITVSLAALLAVQVRGWGRAQPAVPQSGPTWSQASLAPERWWAAATFATPTCEVIAYGGDYFDASGSSVRPTNTLIYQPDQNRWLSIAPQKAGGPPALNHPGLTFDPNHGIAVLFGGSSSSNTTYGFAPSTRTWTTLVASQGCTSSTCPSARMNHAQAWSAVKRAVLVFGGQGSLAPSSATNDLWALVASAAKRGGLTWKWTLLKPAGDPVFGMPPARSRHGMAEIPAGSHAGQMVIYGGTDSSGIALVDTWLYDPIANSYTFLPHAASPTQRQGFAMGLAPSLGAIIVQGGQLNSLASLEVYTQETWMFDHSALSWTPLYVGQPYGNRSYHDIASDTCRGSAVIFDKPATSSGQYPTWILK